VSFAILLVLFRLFHRLESRLESRIDRLQDRVHNDYEALIGKILELDAHVSFGHVDSR
jgi:hypothetical protein